MNNIVDLICEAWRSKRPEILEGIVAESFEWYDSPFEAAVTDVQGLIARWDQDIDSQSNISVTADTIAQDDVSIVAHWRAEFDRNNMHEILDGVFVINVNENNKIKLFRMWWVNSI